jgi:hypothetical protein
LVAGWHLIVSEDRSGKVLQLEVYPGPAARLFELDRLLIEDDATAANLTDSIHLQNTGPVNVQAEVCALDVRRLQCQMQRH